MVKFCIHAGRWEPGRRGGDVKVRGEWEGEVVD